MAEETFNSSNLDESAGAAGENPTEQTFGAETAPARKNPLMSRSNLTLAVLFGMALAGLYLAHVVWGGPQKASAKTTTEMQVDAALTAMSAGGSQKETASAVVDTLYYEAKQRQVPLDRLKGNMFIYTTPEGRIDQPAQTQPQAQQASVENEQQLDQALRAADQLRLQSVLKGTRGSTAMVSNNLLSVGQTIQGWTVQSIEPRQVVLAWKDQQYVLKMPQ